jgi:hypothetical protein
MPRNPELDALLQAQYDWEGAAPNEKAAYQEAFYRLIKHHVRLYNATSAARGKSQITELELQEALSAPYFEFRKSRAAEMRRILNRLK